MVFPEKPHSLLQYDSHQSVILCGNSLKQLDNVPKLIDEICKKITKKLKNGEYLPEYLSSAFYNLDSPIFASPLYLQLLELPEEQNLLISVDETIVNNPLIINEQINEKIRSYKVYIYIASIKYLKLAGI